MSKLTFCPTCGGAAWEVVNKDIIDCPACGAGVEITGKTELVPTTIDSRKSLEALAWLRATEAGLDPALVCALIEIESGWNPRAVRYEPGYQWLYPHELVTLDPVVPAERGRIKAIMRERGRIKAIMRERGWPGTPETEIAGQHFSWGLLQIMGPVPRDYGFTGWFPELCDPEVNLEWGLKHLLWLKGKYGDDPAVLAAAWNAGSPRRQETGYFVNQDYVDRFLAAMEKYKEGGE